MTEIKDFMDLKDINKRELTEQEKTAFAYLLQCTQGAELYTLPVGYFTKDVVYFYAACLSMLTLYAKKNHDYGNSFDKGVREIGDAYAIGRLFDKTNRLINLSKKDMEAAVKDESFDDTLKDLACYAVMYMAAREKLKNEKEEKEAEQ